VFPGLRAGSAASGDGTAAAEVLSLPVFPELTQAEMEAIGDAIVEFFASGPRAAPRSFVGGGMLE
jgi:hypothetical protein